MPEVSRDQPLEHGNELTEAVGCQAQRENLDADDAIALRVVRAEHRAQCPGTDLVKYAKWTQRVGGRGAGGVRVQ